MPTDFSLAQTIAKDVNLASVTLCSTDLDSRLDPLHPPAELQLEHGYRARYELRPSAPEHVYVFVDFKFEAAPGQDPEEPAPQPTLWLAATYLAIYELPSADERDQTALQYFAQLNGTYNIWPYWRELVQTVTGRVGLASYVVPVLRLQPTEVSEEGAKPAATSARKRQAARKRSVTAAK
jgi:hypothetical protein